jgi:hypothetical protein
MRVERGCQGCHDGEDGLHPSGLSARGAADIRWGVSARVALTSLEFHSWSVLRLGEILGPCGKALYLGTEAAGPCKTVRMLRLRSLSQKEAGSATLCLRF